MLLVAGYLATAGEANEFGDDNRWSTFLRCYMSLALFFGEPGARNSTTMEYHIGDTLPDLKGSDLENLTRLQADGHELGFIQTFFTGIPMVSGNPVIHWDGPWAKWIYEHLVWNRGWKTLMPPINAGEQP